MSLADRPLSPAAEQHAGSAARKGLRLRIVAHILSRLDSGRLTLVLPNGETFEHEAPKPGPEATLVLHRWRTLWRTVTHGDIGFAEAYIEGDCSSPNLTKLIELFVSNEPALAGIAGFKPMRLLNRFRHITRANTKRGSKRNIVAHYDLGNNFFEQWLDAGMTYSSALYDEPGQTLEAAQTAKQDAIIDALDIAPNVTPKQRVLEIGCGWGGLAERIAARGAHVTGLTLSPSQLAYAQARFAKAGLTHDLRLQDYRDVTGTFDRIVSIEMLEAVGRAYWPSYFAMLRDRLAPGGRAVLQVITLEESRYDRYLEQVDFIQRYIFPGGMLPTPTIMREQIEAAGLTLEKTVLFGESYAETLAEWNRRFQTAWSAIEPMGFDERFRRLWTYYLAYCEGGFRAKVLDVGLWVIGRG